MRHQADEALPVSVNGDAGKALDLPISIAALNIGYLAPLREILFRFFVPRFATGDRLRADSGAHRVTCLFVDEAASEGRRVVKITSQLDQGRAVGTVNINGGVGGPGVVRHAPLARKVDGVVGARLG